MTFPLVAVLSLLLGLDVFAALHHHSWIKRCTRRLENGSQLVETAKGRVECAATGAGGPVILFVHPQPGGYDQGALLADAAVQHGFRLPAVSRPGYLRTPLDVGPSPAEQADGFAVAHDDTDVTGIPASQGVHAADSRTATASDLLARVIWSAKIG
jgi:hypothetical protein